MKIQHSLEGFDRAVRIFQRMPERLEKTILKKALNKSAELVKDSAVKTNAFEDRTGNLRASIQTTDKVRRRVKSVVRSLIRATAPHAQLVELGHWVKTKNGKKWVPGRRFMLNAYLENKEEILSTIKKEIAPGIERFLRRERKEIVKKLDTIKKNNP